MDKGIIQFFLTEHALRQSEEACRLQYRFVSIPFLSTVEESVASFFSHHAFRLRMVTKDIAYHAFDLWLYDPVRGTSVPVPNTRTKHLTSLLDDFFGERLLAIFEVQLPFDAFGSYSEHFVFMESDALYVLDFCAS